MKKLIYQKHINKICNSLKKTNIEINLKNVKNKLLEEGIINLNIADIALKVERFKNNKENAYKFAKKEELDKKNQKNELKDIFYNFFEENLSKEKCLDFYNKIYGLINKKVKYETLELKKNFKEAHYKYKELEVLSKSLKKENDNLKQEYKLLLKNKFEKITENLKEKELLNQCNIRNNLFIEYQIENVKLYKFQAILDKDNNKVLIMVKDKDLLSQLIIEDKTFKSILKRFGVDNNGKLYVDNNYNNLEFLISINFHFSNILYKEYKEQIYKMKK